MAQQKHVLPNCFEEKISKSKWKNLVKGAVSRANEEEIRSSIEPYKKIVSSIIETENFECKNYLSTLTLSKARTLFKHKYQMTENVKMNCKNDQTIANSLWQCGECLNQNTESHLLWCPGYLNLREDLDLNNNEDLCSYLQKIFTLRCKDDKWKRNLRTLCSWLLCCTGLALFPPSGMWAEPNIVGVACYFCYD